MQTMPKRAGYNLAVLTLAALPIAIGVGGLMILAAPPEWMRGSIANANSDDVFSGAVVWYLMLAIPVALGGLVHQLVLLLTADRAQRGHAKRWLILTSPVVLLGFVVIPRAMSWPPSMALLVPSLALLLTYSALARPLASTAEE